MIAPRWSRDQIHDRGELKAARMVAILQMQDRLTGIPKVRIAAALGVGRHTLDRDLASLDRIAAKAADLTKLLQELVDLEQWDNKQKAGE